MQGVRTLSAQVAYEQGHSFRVKTITHISIHLGSLVVAQATLGGRFSQLQALNEFKRNRSRFNVGEGYPAAQLLGVA